MTITKKALKFRKDFDMNSTSSCKFHHSQWERCQEGEHASHIYLIYRILFMIILVSAMTFSTLCQSYLFEIFLTNWSFTLQTVYAVLFAANMLWKMRDTLMQSFCKKYYHVYPDSNAKAYELKETNSSWDNNIATTDTNSMIVNENSKNGSNCVNIGNGNSKMEDPSQQPLDSTTSTKAVLTNTDGSVSGKSQTSVIVISNNNNNNSRCNNDPPSLLEKCIWVLMTISHTLPYIVSFGYWIFVYKYDPDQKACERFRSHFIVHGATSVLAFVDSLVVAVPVRKSHFVFPSFVLLVYGMFSYIYEAAGGPYRDGKEFIYSILNWRHKPGRTIIIVFVGLILSPLMHLIWCWGFHHLKLWLVSLHLRRRNKTQSQPL